MHDFFYVHVQASAALLDTSATDKVDRLVHRPEDLPEAVLKQIQHFKDNILVTTEVCLITACAVQGLLRLVCPSHSLVKLISLY